LRDHPEADSEVTASNLLRRNKFSLLSVDLGFRK
jgi:hypothetical protein